MNNLHAAAFALLVLQSNALSGEREPWEFRITAVQRDKPTAHELDSYPGLVAKWIVTTSFTNKDRDQRILLKVPNYGATVRAQMTTDDFLSGSRHPLQSKDHDFITLLPNQTIETNHLVYARKNDFGGGFTLFGHFQKNVNGPPEWKGNNFAWEWMLSTTPIENEFFLSITLFDMCPLETNEILGKESAKLWKGKAMTKPVKLKVLDEKTED